MNQILILTLNNEIMIIYKIHSSLNKKSWLLNISKIHSFFSTNHLQIHDYL